MKSVLITGAARRLGADLARRFAADGYRVALHSNSSFADAKALSDALNADGAATVPLQCDLAQNGALAAFFDDVTAAIGPPSVIVNSASVFAYDFPGAMDAAILRASLAVHVTAAVTLMDLAAKAMPPGKSLAIFNILDQKLLNLNPDFYSYTIGKSALHAATKMSQAAALPGIRVFGILPGLLLPSGAQSDARFEEDARKSPLQKRISARDIYGAMAFFIANAGLPGQDLAIDGGESLTGRNRDVALE